MRARHWGLVCLICAWTAVAAAQLRLDSNQPVMLHGGAGSALATLVNTGAAAEPISLQAGRFTDDTSQSRLGTSAVTFTNPSGAPLPAVLAPGARMRVAVNVSGVTDTGTASAPVFNEGKELGRIEAVAADAPLGIAVEGPGGSEHPLTLFRGGTSELTLRNNDALAYTLDWGLQLGDRQVQSGELEMAPRGTARIDLMPGNELYSWTDAIRPAFQTGRLTLTMQGPPEVAPDMMPSRMLPVSLTLRSLSAGWTMLWSYVFVVVLLLIGGLLSLAGSSMLPREMRKNGLRRELEEMAGRINDVSERVDPYLRSLLRMERKRTGLMLRRARMFSPVAAGRLEGCATDTERLRLRLKLAERLGELQRKLDDAAASAPPSVVDGIYVRLQTAAAHLRSFALTGEEASAATRILDTEESALAALDDADAQARAIATRFRDLKTRQKFVPVAYYSDLKAAVPGLFDLTAQPFDDFRNIPHRMMFAIDFGISAIQAVFDFSILRAGAPADAAASDAGDGSGSRAQSARERMAARQPEFVALLGTLSWASLREMLSLLEEMRENVYEEDLLEAVNAKGKAEIAHDPQSARPWRPVRFFIHFKDARLNETEAARRLACKWEFPGEVAGEGWQTCHFFHTGGKPEDGGWEGVGISVSARVASRKTPTAADAKSAAHPVRGALSTKITLGDAERPSYAPAYAEGVRFFIAWVVALIALLAGVLGRIDRMGFVPAAIAILLVGFGADTVKNLLAQNSRKVAG